MIETVWEPIETAPYDSALIFILADGTIHSGRKTLLEWVMYPNTSKEVRGVRDEFAPEGILATYDADAYFGTIPVGWIYGKQKC